MGTNKMQPLGLTVVELLVVLAITGLLASLVLPAVNSARESARRTGCLSQLRQVGLALLEYEETYRVFPPGFDGGLDLNLDDKRWGWGAKILPYIDQRPLFEQLRPNELSLFSTVFNSNRRRLLQTEIALYHCPSDKYMRLADVNRDFSGPVTPPTKNSKSSLSSVHLNHLGFRSAPSNYVGNFGDFWKPHYGIWTEEELKGNGVFGCQTSITWSQLTDGLSNTLAIGERDSTRYAAVWCGVEAWNQCTTQGVSMVVGSAFYSINTPATSYAYTCQGGGSTGFGSLHVNGANFVFCDGSTRFISDSIESITPEIGKPSLGIGTFQRLARYNDGEAIVRP